MGDRPAVAPARKRLQMLLGGVGRFETQFSGNFGPGGRGARLRDRRLDQGENLLLSGGKFGGF